MSTNACSVLRVLAILLVLPAAAAAQTTTATLEGTVTDASGAVIPGASVGVVGVTLAAERTAITDARGSTV